MTTRAVPCNQRRKFSRRNGAVYTGLQCCGRDGVESLQETLGSLKMQVCTVGKTDLSITEKHHAVLLNIILVAKCILILKGWDFFAV